MKTTSRKSELSKNIYRSHIQFYRFLNDTWIFYDLMSPLLLNRESELSKSKSKTKRRYLTPKKDRVVHSRRRDADIAKLFRAQYDRELFRTNIVSIISRFEAHILECITHAIKSQPKKLSLISDKSGISIDLFLSHSHYDDVLSEYIAQKSERLMFSKPDEYLDKTGKILSVEIDKEASADYIEIKATRDALIHTNDLVNQIYLDKAGDRARGRIGDRLLLDRDYFSHVVVTAKRLSGSIMHGVEQKYG